MVATQKGFRVGLGNGHGGFEIEPGRGGRWQWIPLFGEAAKPRIEAVKQRLVERFGLSALNVAEHQRNLIVFESGRQ
jgi:hypothetical protein